MAEKTLNLPFDTFISQILACCGRQNLNSLVTYYRLFADFKLFSHFVKRDSVTSCEGTIIFHEDFTTHNVLKYVCPQ